jgi:hypothetical protein
MKEIINAQVINILNIVPLAENLARKKFISAFLLGLIDSREEQFKEIALHIESKAKLESIERNIQSFFKEFLFDFDKVSLLLLLFLTKGKLDLCVDRTEWDFGKHHGAARAVQHTDDSCQMWINWGTSPLEVA